MHIKILDRADRYHCTIELQDSDLAKMTVGDLMKRVATQSEHLRKLLIQNHPNSGKKQGFDINRMRLTIGDAKGAALSDKRVKLGDAFGKTTSGEVTLIFKDLGPQISWKLVFLIEYFGPILITAVLVVFQKQIYGESKPYNLT